MKRITLSLVQETTMKNLLEVHIETFTDMYGTKENLVNEEVYDELEVCVHLHHQLEGQINTRLLKEGYKIVYGDDWEG